MTDTILAAVALVVFILVLGLLPWWLLKAESLQVRWVGRIFLVLWLVALGWFGYGSVELVREERERIFYHRDAVRDAVRAGKRRVLLSETVSFSWASVCWIRGYERYPLDENSEGSGDNHILREALGNDHVSTGEGAVFFFKLMDGRVVEIPDMNFGFDRLVDDRGIARSVSFVFQPSLKNRRGRLCYLPDAVWVDIRS